jgi:hypothetical protein
MPDFIDVDYRHDTFVEDNWRQVIYGMEFRTDLTARRGALRHLEAARKAFAAMARHADQAVALLPTHRRLVEDICAGAPDRQGVVR